MSDVDQPHEPACACALCGRAVEGPLHDLAYQLPDRVFALTPVERATRTWRSAETNADFIVLDEAIFYVRGVLPVPLASGDEFRFGPWLEVSQADFTEVLRAWDDDTAYARLRFRAALANELPPYGDRALGARVDVATGEVSARPRVVGADDAWLARLLRDGWDQATYETFVRTIPSR